jgi:sulfoacetaldehyde acetyltransferase
VRPFDVGIIGDAKLAATEILRALQKRGSARGPDAARLERIRAEKERWKEELLEMSSSGRKPMSPRRALQEIRKALPRDVIVATDVGNICSMANAYLEFEKPRRFLAAQMFGNCGFAYPAALGAKVGAPEVPTVALVGDGAWGMSMNEVLTAVQERINVVAVVFNNGQWGAEKKNQIDYYGNRFVGTLLMDTNYAEIARAMGAVAYRVDSPDDVGDALREALEADRPAVLDVVVDPSELFEPFRRDALRVPVRYLERYR